MRVVRFPARPTRVSDDVRAALASLGKGGNIVGGVAVLGVTPPDSDLVLDAVLILPRGVLVVIGVDLPDPAMTLTAPLNGEWRTDGWPLVCPADATDGENGDENGGVYADINPAVAALATAGRFADLVHGIDSGIGIGVVIAVGPFVETVQQPPEDLAGPVRVIYPSAPSMLAATEALPPTSRPLTTRQARTVLRGLAPSATELDDAVLSAEGFAAPNTDGSEAPVSPAPPVSSATPPRPFTGAEQVTGSPRRSNRRRVATAAAALLAVAVTTVLILTVGSGDTPTPASPSQHSVGEEATVTVNGVAFTRIAHDRSTLCQPHHAVGDVQAYLTEHGCAELRRGSFTTVLDGRVVAVSLGSVTFTDDTVAAEFHTLAEEPGTGALTDTATQAGRWREPAPKFADAAYLTRREDTTVRLVLADPVEGETEPGDDLPLRVAQAALELPLP